MSRPSVVLSLDAERDLDSLFDWIAADSGLTRAEAILRSLDDAIARLAATPRMGRVRDDLDGSPRTFAVWPWIIFYEPLLSEPGVIVWRVLDGRRDVPRHVRR